MGRIKDVFCQKNVLPVWLMRQAGRYLPEYHTKRKKNFLSTCYTPHIAAEITQQPLKRFPLLDAAIIFSDILTIPDALGQQVDFLPEKGPVLGPYDALRVQKGMCPERLAPVYEAIRLVASEQDKTKDLIGFAGAPWTLACYMLEQQGSKTFNKAKAFGFQHPKEMDALIKHLVVSVVQHLVAQVEAGATVLQIFESWGGIRASNALLVA